MKYEEFQKLNNLRPIERDEIVLDCDDKINGDLGIMRICMTMSVQGYSIRIYKAEGQKSYHGHVRDVPHISELNKEQNKLYKELIIKKYVDIVREYTDAPELDKIDFSVCVADHLIATEGKNHFKYGTIKKLIEVINEGMLNFCEKDIYEKVTNINNIKINKTKSNNSNTLSGKIASKISIIGLADKVELKPFGKLMRVCPFHADKAPSLSLNDERGWFNCFGCNESGNIIKFYAMLRNMFPEFSI